MLGLVGGAPAQGWGGETAFIGCGRVPRVFHDSIPHFKLNRAREQLSRRVFPRRFSLGGGMLLWKTRHALAADESATRGVSPPALGRGSAH